MQIAQATEQVARRRQELESSIEALKTFERDYRARLRGFVEAQLRSLDQEVTAMNQEVKAIDQQVKVIEGSMDAPPSPELIAASLEALKTLVLNYATLVRSFAQGQINTLEHTVPIGSLAPQESIPPAEADGDPSST
jgi:chromosome segregation ATPase